MCAIKVGDLVTVVDTTHAEGTPFVLKAGLVGHVEGVSTEHVTCTSLD